MQCKAPKIIFTNSRDFDWILLSDIWICCDQQQKKNKREIDVCVNTLAFVETLRSWCAMRLVCSRAVAPFRLSDSRFNTHTQTQSAGKRWILYFSFARGRRRLQLLACDLRQRRIQQSDRQLVVTTCGCHIDGMRASLNGIASAAVNVCALPTASIRRVRNSRNSEWRWTGVPHPIATLCAWRTTTVLNRTRRSSVRASVSVIRFRLRIVFQATQIETSADPQTGKLYGMLCVWVWRYQPSISDVLCLRIEVNSSQRNMRFICGALERWMP